MNDSTSGLPRTGVRGRGEGASRDLRGFLSTEGRHARDRRTGNSAGREHRLREDIAM